VEFSELAEEIVRAERRHISREPHDVVAHNIGAMQVLMGAARTTMAREADQPALLEVTGIPGRLPAAADHAVSGTFAGHGFTATIPSH